MLRKVHTGLIRILRWSEKYTKTDMVYLAHGSFWLSSSSLITGAVSFGLALAFANLLTKDTYGTYKYILTLFGLFCVACLRGMDTVVSQGAARGNDGTVVMGLFAKMRWSVLGSLTAAIGAVYYWYGGNHVLAASLIVAAIFIPLMEPLGIFNAVLVGKRNFQLSSILGILGQVFSAFTLIIALFLTNNPIVIFAVYAGSWSLSRYLSLQYTLRTYQPNEKNEPGALSYALHSSVITGSSVLIGSLDSILVYHYLGAAELAIYAFAMAPVSHVRTILNTPTVLAIPKFAGQKTAQIRQVLFKRTRHLASLGLAFTIGYCILAVPFFHMFFPKYTDAVPYSLAFSATIFLQVATAMIGAVVDSRVTLIPKRLLYFYNIPGILLAASSFLLIPYFGIWGAIIGQVISYATSSGLSFLIWYEIQEKEHDHV